MSYSKVSTGGVIRRRDRRMWLVMLGVFVGVFVFSFLAQRFKGGEEVEAASLAGFDPGYIISDYQMGNYSSMSEADIQAFLTAKNGCGNRDYGYYVSLSGNPNYKWHFENGHFICLSEERFGNNDNEIGFQYGETAAHIIWQAAQDYRINPQVLIVLLQKETGLITDPIPNNGDYRKATGFGCPDTAACSSKYYGFKNQIRNAAALFRSVLDGGWTNYPLGNNYIQYNPNAACGGSVVNVRSLATSALYRYTPYQPNAGALAAGYGTASCGAYGNRNFYLYFEDWFGGITNTSVAWESMKEERVMTIEKSTLIIDAGTNSALNEWTKMGESYYFVRKTTVFWNGERQMCLQRDGDVGTNRCILMARMSDFELSAMDTFDEPRRYKIIDYTCAVYLRHKEVACDVSNYGVGTVLEVVGSLKIGDEMYLVESHRNDGYAILAKRAKEFYEYEEIGEKLMKLKDVNYKYQIGTNVKVQLLTTAENPYILVAEKVKVDGKIYYRTAHDVRKGVDYVIPESALSEDTFVSFLYPRNLIMNRDGSSKDLITGKVCREYKKGEIRKFLNKIEYDGIMYYQNQDEKGTQCVVNARDLSETVYNFDNIGANNRFVDFLYPRNMRVLTNTYLINLNDGSTCEEYIKGGDIQKYSTKQEVNGMMFYRSEANSVAGSVCATPASVVGEV